MSEFSNGWLAKASESLEAAASLLEAGYPDFAVERAFFSMYYIASDWLGVKERASTNHQATIAAFRRKFGAQKSLAMFVEYLAEAEKTRAIVEMSRDRELTFEEAELHIQRAERLPENG